MKIPIFDGELSPQNMVRVKGGDALKCAGGLMGVAYGEALMKGGRASLAMPRSGIHETSEIQASLTAEHIKRSG